MDYNLAKTARLFGRFNYLRIPLRHVLSLQLPGLQQPGLHAEHVAGIDFNTGSITHTVRFSYLKFQNRILDAVRGSTLPFADYPVAINIGTFTVGPNLLAPQATPQSDHQIKYDGSKIIGKHILRFGSAITTSRVEGLPVSSGLRLRCLPALAFFGNDISRSESIERTRG